MKWGFVVLLLLSCAPVLAQDARSARATYAKNGVLIGLSDLAPLRACSVRSIEGKVSAVKEEGGTVRFSLKSKNDKMTFQFPVSMLAPAEQYSYRKDFLHKGLKLRASGYKCKGEGADIETISVERAY
jgi:hypothetical protein